jgi:Ca-activated chloride channel family protein
MRLAEPGWLLLLILVPLPWWFQRARPRISWPSLEGFSPRRVAGLRLLAPLPILLRSVALASMAVALARPQSVGGRTTIRTQGAAIVVALDHSSSMNTVDFPVAQAPHSLQDRPATIARLDAARSTLIRFVAGRPDDLVGLVVFANEPDLACPPTLDHGFLAEHARAVRPARPDEDGTNIGDAIVWSLDALRAVSPRQKVLVLLTDGHNTPARRAGAAPIDPETAAALAHDLGIRVHTIAIGKAGGLLHTYEPVTGLDRLAGEVDGPDRALLERLARIGGGRPFAATDASALAKVFREIDALEKSPVQDHVTIRYREDFARWLVLALTCLVLDRLLSSGRLRRLP